MKIISLLLFIGLAFTACSSSSDECVGDDCVCTSSGGCDFECSPGATECHIQGNSGPLDVQCADNEECHVECAMSASCNVDCGNSPECHVTCPATGCTVTDCVGANCVVSCGVGIPTAATRNGSTATCP